MGGEASAVGVINNITFSLKRCFFAPDAIAGQARGYGLAILIHLIVYERLVFDRNCTTGDTASDSLILKIVGGRLGPVTVVMHLMRCPGRQIFLLRANRIQACAWQFWTQERKVEEQLTSIGSGV